MMIFVMWVAAGVAGSNTGLANLVVSFAVVGMLVVCMMLCKTLGTSKLMDEVHNVPLIASMSHLGEKDWARGLFLLVSWPAILGYCVLSFLNQLVRRFCPCSKDL